MNAIRLIPVPADSRWPSGDGVEIALLPLSEDELATRLGQTLVRGVEDGLGPWAAIGGRLPSGGAVEFICYKQSPVRGVILRVDKNLSYSAALDEALQLVGMSRAELRSVSPLAAA